VYHPSYEVDRAILELDDDSSLLPPCSDDKWQRKTVPNV
jgi:hypothetical protein